MQRGRFPGALTKPLRNDRLDLAAVEANVPELVVVEFRQGFDGAPVALGLQDAIHPTLPRTGEPGRGLGPRAVGAEGSVLRAGSA